MGDVQFDQVFDLAMKLSTDEQVRLIVRLECVIHDVLMSDENSDDSSEIQPTWTDEEVAELMKVTPMTGAEIVASGVLGGWEDKDITDGAEWVNIQKRKRQLRHRW